MSYVFLCKVRHHRHHPKGCLVYFMWTWTVSLSLWGSDIDLSSKVSNSLFFFYECDLL